MHTLSTQSLGNTTPLRTSSDTARSTVGCQAELPPSTGYDSNLYFEDTTSNLCVSISSDTMQSSATRSETEDAATTLRAKKLTFQIWGWTLRVIDGMRKDIYKPRQQELPRGLEDNLTLVFYRLEHNVAADFVKKDIESNNRKLSKSFLWVKPQETKQLDASQVQKCAKESETRSARDANTCDTQHVQTEARFRRTCPTGVSFAFQGVHGDRRKKVLKKLKLETCNPHNIPRVKLRRFMETRQARPNRAGHSQPT